MKKSITLILSLTASHASLHAQNLVNGSLSGIANSASSISPAIYGSGDTFSAQVNNSWNYISNFNSPTATSFNAVSLWDFSAIPTANTGPGEALDAFEVVNQSSNGGQFAVMFTHTSTYDIGISQTLNGFQPNQKYSLMFEMANMAVGVYDHGGGSSYVGFDAYFDVGLSHTLEGTLQSPALNVPFLSDIYESVFGPWSTVTLNFTTDSSVTTSTNLTLSFIAREVSIYGFDDESAFYGYHSGPQLALDGISITPAPEPSATLLLLGAGLGGLFIRRRKL